jgi:hypothetical protein
MPRRSFSSYTAARPEKRTVASHHIPNVTAKQSEVQPKDGEKQRKAYYLPFAFTWRSGGVAMGDLTKPKIFKVIIVLSIVTILVIASMYYFFYSNKNQLNASEWNIEYNEWLDSWADGNNPEFQNYAPGDIIIVNGEISEIHRMDDTRTITDYLWITTFVSLKDCDKDIWFHGDLTGNYSVGDKVTIKINIVEGIIFNNAGNEISGEIIENYDYGLPATAIKLNH